MGLSKHLEAVRQLNEIRDLVIKKIKDGCSERHIASFILREYKKRKMKTEKIPIISFGKNTSEIHHAPKDTKIKEGPIMLDIWAKLDSGNYADLTWMLYKGKPNHEFIKMFGKIVESRNKAIKFLMWCLKKRYLPTMFEIDAISRSYLGKNLIGYLFKHAIGHPLGIKEVHGDSLNKEKGKEYYQQLKINQPYTIEPGIYFDKKYGIRLENDFWIDSHFNLHMTTPQNKLILI